MLEEVVGGGDGRRATRTSTFLQLSLRSRGQRSVNTLSFGESFKFLKIRTEQKNRRKASWWSSHSKSRPFLSACGHPP